MLLCGGWMPLGLEDNLNRNCYINKGFDRIRCWRMKWRGAFAVLCDGYMPLIEEIMIGYHYANKGHGYICFWIPVITKLYHKVSTMNLRVLI